MKWTSTNPHFPALGIAGEPTKEQQHAARVKLNEFSCRVQCDVARVLLAELLANIPVPGDRDEAISAHLAGMRAHWDTLPYDPADAVRELAALECDLATPLYYELLVARLVRANRDIAARELGATWLPGVGPLINNPN